MLILRKCHIPCHYLFQTPSRMSLRPKKGCVAVSNLGVYAYTRGRSKISYMKVGVVKKGRQ